MASSHDFFMGGDHESGRRIIATTLEAEGFVVTTTPQGGLLAKRGNAALTVFFGALAGSKFQISLVVDFMVDDAGDLVARLHRGMTSAAIKGGAIGAAKTNKAFETTADALGEALQSRGLLVRSLSNQ